MNFEAVPRLCLQVNKGRPEPPKGLRPLQERRALQSQMSIAEDVGRQPIRRPDELPEARAQRAKCLAAPHQLAHARRPCRDDLCIGRGAFGGPRSPEVVCGGLGHLAKGWGQRTPPWV